jgi:hypothetical protein
MKPKHFYLASLVLMLLFLLTLPALAGALAAPKAATYDLSWNVIGGGGTSFTIAGNYTLGATIGQSIAGSLSSNPDYLLNAGFWFPVSSVIYFICVYLPLALK